MKAALLSCVLLLAFSARASTMNYTITSNGGGSISFSLPINSTPSERTLVTVGTNAPQDFLIDFFPGDLDEMLISCPQSEYCMSPDGVWQVFGANMFTYSPDTVTLNAGTWQSTYDRLTLTTTAVDPVDTPEAASGAFLLLGMPLLWALRRYSRFAD